MRARQIIENESAPVLTARQEDDRLREGNRNDDESAPAREARQEDGRLREGQRGVG